MALFKVSTLVQFKHDYFVEAECLEHAYDEITMRESGTVEDYFEEAGQRYLGETILSGEESAYDEFEDYLEDCRRSNTKTVCSYWMGEDLIRVVEYEDDDTNSPATPELKGSDTITIRAYNNEFDFDYQDNMNSVGHEVFKQMGTSLILGHPNIGDPGKLEQVQYDRWNRYQRGY